MLNESEQIIEKITMRQNDQERMKYVNNAHRAYMKDPNEPQLIQINFPNLTPEDLKLVITHNQEHSWQPEHPFATHEITNNGAEIRRLAKRLEEINARSVKADTVKGREEHVFEGGLLIYNYDLDRVQLLYDEKPDGLTIALLKSRGFKWSPRELAWQRQLTANGKAAAQYMISLKI